MTFAQKTNEMQDSYNYKRALELIDSEQPDWSTALDFLRQEVSEHEKNGYAYYWMGAIYDRNDQEGDALTSLNNAIKYLKKDKPWLIYAYRLRARVYLQLNNEEQAKADWASALKAQPGDVTILTERAEYYYQNNLYDLSDKDYDAIIKVSPGETLGYMGKGRNALEKSDYAEAERLFSYSIKLKPDQSQAYAFRAETYMKQNKNNEATNDLISALDIDSNDKAFSLMQDVDEPQMDLLQAKFRIQEAKNPNISKWPYFSGIVYERKGKYYKAMDAYKKAYDIDASAYLLHRTAICHEYVGEYSLGLESIDQALRMDSTEMSYYSEKADILYEMGRTNEAIEAYSKYIKMNPEFSGGYYRRGFIKDNANMVDGAIEDYTTAIVLNPNYAYAYLGRGDQYVKKGNTEAAMADFQKVVEIDSLYLEEGNCAQYAYLALGQKDKAIAFLDSIIGKYDNEHSMYDAACLYGRMGDKDKALSYLEKALEKGFRRYQHIMNDDDLDLLKDMPEFKTLIQKYEEKTKKEEQVQKEELGISDNRQEHISEIPFTRSNGICKVSCTINDLPLHFVFDTGASEVSLSMVEATFMMKNNYLTKDDVVGSQYFQDANGNINEGTVVNLRKVKFGDSELDNVKASVVKNQKAPLLLGQSVLSRLGSIEIDNAKNVIRIKYMK